MRTTEIEIGGIVYPLCFSLRANQMFCERYGTLSGSLERIKQLSDQNDTSALTDEHMEQLAILLDCGQRNAAARGVDSPPPPEADELKDLFGVVDLLEIQRCIVGAINAGSLREVQAAAPPNGEGAGDAPPAPES